MYAVLHVYFQKCNYSTESFRSILSCGAVYQLLQRDYDSAVKNPNVW